MGIAIEIGGWEVPGEQLLRETASPAPLGAVVEPTEEAIDAGWVPGTMPDTLIGTADSHVMGSVVSIAAGRQAAADRRLSKSGGEAKRPKHERGPSVISEIFGRIIEEASR